MNKKALISFLHKVGNTSFKSEDISISATNDMLILITAAGQITGTPLLKADNPDAKQTITDGIFLETAKTYSNETKEDSFLLLKNAVLQTSSGAVSYRYLYVFTDDIIAATIGNTNPD